MPGPVQPIIPDRDGKVIHAIKIVQALAIVYVVFLAFFLKWLSPSFTSLFASILLGAALGVAYSFLHHRNKAQKEYLSSLVRIGSPAYPSFNALALRAFGLPLPPGMDSLYECWKHIWAAD